MSQCRTYHSVYPKYQTGSYAEFFNIQSNSQNKYFVANPQRQTPCLGTQVVCYDLTFGALAPNSAVPKGTSHQSLRAQALYNAPLRGIVANRAQNQFQPTSGSHVQPWWVKR